MHLVLIFHCTFLQEKSVYFVTNNSSKSRAEYLQKFKKLAFEAYEVT